jgi:hypothetical protein
VTSVKNLWINIVQSAAFESGQLVRYRETNTRWYFAIVRRSRRDGIELRFFDGGTSIVSADRVDSIETLLTERERAFSRTRAQLTALFYGRELERLRAPRFREMKRALRRAGISVDPKEWPGADTRIQLWRDDSFVGRDHDDATLAGLLPQWLEPFVLPPGSRDPLGLQAPAERLVNEVLPGLTVFTYRAGYYGFLTWAIRKVNGLTTSALPRRTSRREAVNALERALVLCEFIYHGLEDDSCSLLGQRSKLRVLSSNHGDRYGVPESILKNQNSAGSFRLFATSLVSLGLVEEANELAADGLLPFRLTSLGDALANAFAHRVDPHFMAFALGGRTEARDTLRGWGRELCFCSIAHHARYRAALLSGLLLGDSRDAEKRYRTVRHLYAEALLDKLDGAALEDNVSEDDAVALEGDVQGAGISSVDVVLHFYGRPPREDFRALQALAAFELLSVGLAGIFRAAVASVESSGKTDLARLTKTMSSSGSLQSVWSTPIAQAKAPTAKSLVSDLKLRERGDTDSIEVAHISGALLVRVLRDPILPSAWDMLTQMAAEPIALIDQCLRRRMELPLRRVLPDLLIAMAERHKLVSERKGRQPWLFTDGGTLVRDDPRPMGFGLHALRFPQLGSLARDLRLREQDLQNA